MRLEPAAERVDHELLGEHARELLRTRRQRFAELGRAGDRRAVRELAVSVDSAAGLARAPLADGVEVLETQADRIHDVVARRANRIRAMLGEALTQRALDLAALVAGKRRHVPQRPRRR